ncbi:MAG: 4-alpha-glucanotransferase [Vicinamibacterales bacterium]
MRLRRRSGVLVPLFSAPSRRSWGIGEISDIAHLAAWLREAGQHILQLLPLNEMASGTQSPYSAMSAMAIDPIYIAMDDVADFVEAGGWSTLTGADRAAIEQARQAATVEYGRIRPVKERALRTAFRHFASAVSTRGSDRAAALAAFVERESWWLADYALFRALHDREHGVAWMEWPEAVRRRDPAALAATRDALADEVRYYEYVQWIASEQWDRARALAASLDVALFGDLPFMVDLHSADVWAHQANFHLDRSVGVPPDAFSATGQDWGMPAYNWPAFAEAGFAWLEDRARRSAALFDGYRVDHLVGFYRTYSRPRDGQGDAAFAPADEHDQVALGERVLALFRAPGAEIIAEDLGVVPDFVRRSLERMAVPGFRVFRWEREWDSEGQPFRDPADYPAVSVATTGTHDTEPLRTWWDQAGDDERRAVAAIPSIAALAPEGSLHEQPFVPHVRDVLVQALLGAQSAIVLFPIQDVFGWADRINEPATVSDRNWSYRLPWPVDQLGGEAEAVERQRALREWARACGRTDG